MGIKTIRKNFIFPALPLKGWDHVNNLEGKTIPIYKVFPMCFVALATVVCDLVEVYQTKCSWECSTNSVHMAERLNETNLAVNF